MNYLSIYTNLLEQGQNRLLFPGCHRHHIIPKHLSGSDNIENISYLTRQEHRIIHRIRYKLFNNKADLIASIALGGKNPGGYILTEETRDKIRKKAIGRTAWNKGLPNEVARKRMLENNPMKNPIIAKKVHSKLIGRPTWNKGIPTTRKKCIKTGRFISHNPSKQYPHLLEMQHTPIPDFL